MSARAAWRLESLGRTSVYRYVAGKVDWLANGLPSEGQNADEPRITEVMDRDVPTCAPGERVGEVRARLGQGDLCVVVSAERVVLGTLRGKQFASAAADALVDDVLDPDPSTYRPNVSIQDMAEHLGTSDARRVLVTTGDGVLLGLLTREAVEQAVHAAHNADGPHLAMEKAT